MATVIENAGVKQVDIYGDDEKIIRVIGNHFVDINTYIQSETLKIKEKVK